MGCSAVDTEGEHTHQILSDHTVFCCDGQVPWLTCAEEGASLQPVTLGVSFRAYCFTHSGME
jgi:hypothetical protein